MLYSCVQPEEWIPFSIDFGNDKSVMLRIKYIGSAASGIISIDSAGDITFEHGVLASEAVDDDTNLDDGGVGIIDVSADITDYHSLVRRINSSDNWVAWLVGALPDADPHTTTVGHWTEVSGGSAIVANGYAVMTDDSDSKYIAAALTLQGPPNKTHNTDHGVYHELHRVTALSTYGSGSSTLQVFACDDDSGVSAAILTLDAGATTVEKVYPAATVVLSDIPLTNVKGKRLVVRLINTASMSVVRLKIEGRSRVFAPAVRAAKVWSANQ